MVFAFPFFAIFASRLSSCYMLSPCLSPDSGPSCDILDLADVANVFVADFIPQHNALQRPHFR